MDVKELVKEMAGIIDLRKLIEYGQILIEFDDYGATVTGFDDGMITRRVELEDGKSSKKTIEALCAMVQVVRSMTGWDSTKHADYRFTCGLSPNSDRTCDELYKIIDRKTIDKLYEAGYEVVKEPM